MGDVVGQRAGGHRIRVDRLASKPPTGLADARGEDRVVDQRGPEGGREHEAVEVAVEVEEDVERQWSELVESQQQAIDEIGLTIARR